MTKNDAKKRITAAIKKLNAMNNNVYFELEETEYSVQLICRSKSIKSTPCGLYGQTAGGAWLFRCAGN